MRNFLKFVHDDKHAFLSHDIQIEEDTEKVILAWFPLTVELDEVAAYTVFVKKSLTF